MLTAGYSLKKPAPFYFPTEILLLIFQYCSNSFPTLLRFSLVCKYWKSVAQNPVLYRKFKLYTDDILITKKFDYFTSKFIYADSLRIVRRGKSFLESTIQNEIASKFNGHLTLRVISMDSNYILQGSSNCPKLEELSCWYFSGREKDLECMEMILKNCFKLKLLKITFFEISTPKPWVNCSKSLETIFFNNCSSKLILAIKEWLTFPEINNNFLFQKQPISYGAPNLTTIHLVNDKLSGPQKFPKNFFKDIAITCPKIKEILFGYFIFGSKEFCGILNLNNLKIFKLEHCLCRLSSHIIDQIFGTGSDEVDSTFRWFQLKKPSLLSLFIKGLVDRMELLEIGLAEIFFEKESLNWEAENDFSEINLPSVKTIWNSNKYPSLMKLRIHEDFYKMITKTDLKFISCCLKNLHNISLRFSLKRFQKRTADQLVFPEFILNLEKNVKNLKILSLHHFLFEGDFDDLDSTSDLDVNKIISNKNKADNFILSPHESTLFFIQTSEQLKNLVSKLTSLTLNLYSFIPAFIVRTILNSTTLVELVLLGTCQPLFKCTVYLPNLTSLQLLEKKSGQHRLLLSLVRGAPKLLRLHVLTPKLMLPWQFLEISNRCKNLEKLCFDQILVQPKIFFFLNRNNSFLNLSSFRLEGRGIDKGSSSCLMEMLKFISRRSLKLKEFIVTFGCGFCESIQSCNKGSNTDSNSKYYNCDSFYSKNDHCKTINNFDFSDDKNQKKFDESINNLETLNLSVNENTNIELKLYKNYMDSVSQSNSPNKLQNQNSNMNYECNLKKFNQTSNIKFSKCENECIKSITKKLKSTFLFLENVQIRKSSMSQVFIYDEPAYISSVILK